jgi:hypothetical protein
MDIDNKIVVEQIGYLVNLLRESGKVNVVTAGVSPLDTCDRVVYDCGTCEKDLTVGLHEYTIINPHYYFGNQFEIQRILDAKDLSFATKYPCIILEMPFTESVGVQGVRANIRLLLCNYIDSEDVNGNPVYSQAYQERFKPVLYPLYDNLIKKLESSNIARSYEITSKTDRPLFGETKLVSSDYWDVIDLRLSILFNQSCKHEVCEQLIYNN